MALSTEMRARAAADASDGELLTAFAADRSPFVRAAAAGNSATPLEVLARLAGDSARQPQEAVAVLAAHDARVLEIVLTRGGERARVHLAELAAGITDRDLEWFTSTLDAAEGVKDGWTLQLVVGLERRARDPLPTDVQRRIADDPSWQVRAGLARTTAEPAVLQDLTGDRHPRVRVACIENLLVTDEQVDRLLHDPQRDVRAWVAAASPLSVAQMLDVAARETSEDVLDMLVHRDDVPRSVLLRVIDRQRSRYLTGYALRAWASARDDLPPEVVWSVARPGV